MILQLAFCSYLNACPFHESCDGAFDEGAQEQAALGQQQSQAYAAR